jgi:hypothetical protein
MKFIRIISFTIILFVLLFAITCSASMKRRRRHDLPEGWFNIVGKSGFCVSAAFASRGRLFQANCGQSDTLLWKAEKVKNGVVLLSKNNFALDNFENKKCSENPIISYQRNNTPAQVFAIEPRDGAFFQLRNIHSNKCLDDTSAKGVGNLYVIMNCKKENANQMYELRAIQNPTTPTPPIPDAAKAIQVFNPRIVPGAVNPTIVLGAINPALIPGAVNQTIVPGAINPALIPGAVNPELPGAVNPVKPGAVNPEMPGAVNPVKPGAVNPEMPGAVNPVKPGAVNPEMPGAVNPVKPGAVNPEMPGAVNPEMPGAVNPVKPGAVNPEMPGAVNPEMPGAVNPVKPGAVNPAMPALNQDAIAKGKQFCETNCVFDPLKRERRCLENEKLVPCRRCTSKPGNLDNDIKTVCNIVCNSQLASTPCDFYGYINDRKKRIPDSIFAKFGLEVIRRR